LWALPLGGGSTPGCVALRASSPGVIFVGASRRFSLALQAFFPVLIKALHFSLFLALRAGETARGSTGKA